MLTTDMVVGSVYTVDLYPERLHGKVLTDVTFMGRVDATLVGAYGVIPEEEHLKVYSSLPDGVPDNAYQYSWVLFKNLNGEVIPLGEPWVENVTGGDTVDIWEVSNIKGDSATPNLIQSALTSVGIYEFSIRKTN